MPRYSLGSHLAASKLGPYNRRNAARLTPSAALARAARDASVPAQT